MLTKNNVAHCDPDISADDITGYTVSSRWLNVQTGVEWICTDTTTGVAKWRPVAVGYGWPSGTYRVPEYITALGDSQPAANTAIYLPILIRETTTVDKIGLSLVTAQAGAKARLALYHGIGGLPGYLRSDFGELDLSAGSGLLTISTSITVNPGLYFLAAVFNAAGTMPTVKRVSGATLGAVIGGSAADLTGGNAGRYYSAAMTYAAWPYTAPAVAMATGTDGAAICLRKQ